MRRKSPRAPGHLLGRLWMPEAKEIHRLPLMRSSPKLHCPLPPSLEPTALSFPLRKARSQARFRNEPLPELNRRHPLQNPSPRCLGPRLRQRISPRIQFQPPNGGHWDYRPGHNNGGGAEFTKLPHPKYDAHEWSQVELLVNRKAGTAQMAVAQPPGTKAVEVLAFHESTAGQKGPIAWQMHNKGLFDEYKDVRIEVNPKEERLLTVEQ